MSGSGPTPSFEFALPEKQSAPSAKPAEAKKEAIQFNDSTPEGIGKKIDHEFTTPTQKNAIASELAKGITENFHQFSPEFQARYGKNGQPDMTKILALYGLQTHLADQFTPEGQLKPAPTSIETNLPSSSKLPERPSDAMTGEQFMNQMNQLGEMNDKGNQHKMEEAILAQVAAGNVPSFCRPEHMKQLQMHGDGMTVSYKTSADYLAIGSDSNFIRVPMTPLLAQELSKRFGWGLPTAAMTDNTYDNADIKLTGTGYVTAPRGTPEFAEQNKQMQRNGWIIRHNTDINHQLGSEGLARLEGGQALVAGHKKDVIISRYALEHPGKLDFRGLYINGQPIQHNPAHEDTYRDYAHGFRPVDGNVVIAYADGHTETKPYYEALKDPAVARVLNGAEGAFDAQAAYQDKRPPTA